MAKDVTTIDQDEFILIDVVKVVDTLLNMSPIVDILSQHFQVIIFDNRADGQTTDGGVILLVELMAQDVMELSDALNLQKPHIVGRSMGGTIVQSIAA